MFEDKFDRVESQEPQDEPRKRVGHQQRTTPRTETSRPTFKTVIFSSRLTPMRSHSVTVKRAFAFKDGTIEIKVKLNDERDTLRINLCDYDEKSVHAGHLADAMLETYQVTRRI